MESKESSFHMYFDKQGNPIEFKQLAELAELPDYRYIGREDFKDGSWVSTIWTGMNLYEGKKQIFETMYFPANGSTEMIGRWETEEEASERHKEAVKKLVESGAVKVDKES